jgi:hypothetical protein
MNTLEDFARWFVGENAPHETPEGTEELVDQVLDRIHRLITRRMFEALTHEQKLQIEDMPVDQVQAFTAQCLSDERQGEIVSACLDEFVAQYTPQNSQNNP